jgi:hypothetical protein
MPDMNQFIANIKTGGLSRANRYELVLTAPSIPALGNFANNGGAEQLRYRCSTASLPSKSIATSETKIYGPVRLAPYQITYDQLSFSVYLSDDFRERQYFEDWMHYVIDYDTNRIRYYSDYSASNLQLLVMDETNKVTNTYVFEEAYPLSVGEVSMSYSNEEPATCDISMTYRKYISKSSYTESGGRSKRQKREKTNNSLNANTDPQYGLL